MFCQRCGESVPDTAQFCYKCGEKFNQTQPSFAASTAQPEQAQQQPNKQQLDPAQKQSTESAAIISLVCGILSLIIPFVGIILGIIAIVYYNKVRKAGITNGKATAGLVLGIIGLSVYALYLIIAVPLCICAVSAASTIPFQDIFNNI